MTMIQKLVAGICVLFLLVWVVGCTSSNETVVKPRRSSTNTGSASTTDQGQASNNRSGTGSRGARSESSSGSTDASNTGNTASGNNAASSNTGQTTLDKIAERDDLPEEVKKRFEKAKRKK